MDAHQPFLHSGNDPALTFQGVSLLPGRHGRYGLRRIHQPLDSDATPLRSSTKGVRLLDPREAAFRETTALVRHSGRSALD